MEEPTFNKLIDQLRKVKLSRDKFFILERINALWFVNGKQLCDLVMCFPHSEDKRLAVKLLEKRICARLTASLVAQIIKSASFSKDRVAILEVLVRHLKDLDNRQTHLTVVGAFDFFIDKDLAWAVIAKQCEVSGNGSLPVIPESEEPDLLLEYPIEINSFVQSLAEGNVAHLTVFDLPIFGQMTVMRQSLPEMRENVEKEVQLRKEANLNFLIPSRVYKITNSLMPGKRLTGPELARYGSCPDLLAASGSICGSQERISCSSSDSRNRRDSSDSGIEHTTDSDKENSADHRQTYYVTEEVTVRPKSSKFAVIQSRRRPASLNARLVEVDRTADNYKFISSGVTGRKPNKIFR